ncbi:DUF3817 domain-containing protein [Mucilaginibacter sabulilitoris]|uniref:DUF3817 domain-containing protein n=1 Tax=Mucilaginibacter sabulilitoris TaxID=1173583 RepID=A0ABZ0TEW7_9SPHI|nr:DUF3817 domain-containing protein [Mucilaginibacter sabulilitoris]WPU91724.1 DUF3817 domain-containing protein [Mucilaginibacter sabulilitoris]
MINLLKTQLGRLKLAGYVEGTSLILLLFVAVPLKYFAGNPALVRAIGPVHGLLFLWFIISTLSVGVEEQWKFRETTWKVLIACVIPFGTFYIDKFILKNVPDEPDPERVND